jgi:hypothetical protein
MNRLQQCFGLASRIAPTLLPIAQRKNLHIDHFFELRLPQSGCGADFLGLDRIDMELMLRHTFVAHDFTYLFHAFRELVEWFLVHQAKIKMGMSPSPARGEGRGHGPMPA